MSRATWGALIGLACAAGILLLGSWIRARRPATVLARISPFVGPVTGQTVDRQRPFTAATVWSTMWLLLEPSVPLAGARPRPDARAGGSVVGAVGGALVALALTQRSGSLVGIVVLSLIGAVAGWLTADRVAAARTRRRRQRIEAQLPAIAELLAFSVSAGESPLAALERVSTATSGDLADEIRLTIAEVRSGLPLDAALAALGARVESASLQRFVEGLGIALARGTPIADVLRAQAADARADERRQLLELAGRKDVLMLVPVVFLVLPTVVLVALYPGLQSLAMVVT